MGSPSGEKGRGEDEMRRKVQILNPFTSLSLKQLSRMEHNTTNKKYHSFESKEF